MTLQIESDLADRLTARAETAGTTAEALALEILRKEVTSPPIGPKLPPDEFMRLLREVAIDCKTSLPSDAWEREAIYD